MTVAPAPRPSDELSELIVQHLPLVTYAVTDLCRRLPTHVRRDELESAGREALTAAALSFEEGRGVPFARYASRRVSGALLDELRSWDWASRGVRRRARAHDDAAEQLSRELGRPARPDEMAERLGVSPGDVSQVQADVHRSVVLSVQVVLDGPAAESVLPTEEQTPEQVLVQREREAYLHDAVELLPERLRRVVLAVFFEEQPVSEVATELGVTESRISQMRAEAMGLLRDALHANLSPEQLAPEARPGGRVARRKEAYYAEVAARSSFGSRLGVPAPRSAEAPVPRAGARTA